MNEQILIFKEFLPKNKLLETRADRVWFHPNGRMVVLLDGVSGCSDPVESVDLCTAYLDGLEKNHNIPSPSQLLMELHKHISNHHDKMAVAACVQCEDGKTTCAWVGNPRLYLFTDEKVVSLLGEPLSQPMQVLGMDGDVVPMTTSFTIPTDGICLLSSDGLGHQALLDRKHQILLAHSNIEWQKIGEVSAIDEDWSMVVFPIEQSFSFEKNSWPYNPFVGPQEDREHEKRGLAQLADALFADEDFSGFRIVGGTRFARSQSSRLLDGILVSPWGVVCLELKDHDCQVQLPLTGRKQMIICNGKNHHAESNPVEKLTEALRPFAEFDLGCNMDRRLRNIGTVVFTHPRAQVVCLSHDGAEKSLPVRSAEVIVSTPTSFPRELKLFVKSFIGNRNKPPFDKHQIDTICKKLTEAPSSSHGDAGGMRKIDRYLFQEKPNEEESTSYYQVFDGTFANRDRKIWVKKFARAQLARGKQSQVEESRLREIEALLIFQNEGCVQHFLTHATEEDGLFVILEHIEGPRLDQWLEKNPSREDRLKMLREIAEILVLLDAEQIVHRGLSPHCIRIRMSNCQPVLINFELCQMDVVATLPLSGRRLLDIQYVAKEVHTSGAKITCAADVYSFGKIICLTLAGELPFRTFEDQIMAVKKLGFWERVGHRCGLTEAQGKDLARILSSNPDRRPSPRDVLTILEGWT